MVRAKQEKSYLTGSCNYCGKKHYSNEGNWIVNAERMHFCHGVYTCFDKYLKLCKEMQHKDTWMANLHKYWKTRTPYAKNYRFGFPVTLTQEKTENKNTSDTNLTQQKKKVLTANDFLAGVTRLEPINKTTGSKQ